MTLADVVEESFRRSVSLYDELVAALPETALAMTLPGIRSNTIGAQLWCVVGARESYTRAIAAGEWSGFRCSLTSDGSRRKAAVRAGLSESAGELLKALRDVAVLFLLSSTVLFFAFHRFWPWGWGVGIVLLLFAGPSDSEKKGYRL